MDENNKNKDEENKSAHEAAPNEIKKRPRIAFNSQLFGTLRTTIEKSKLTTNKKLKDPYAEKEKVDSVTEQSDKNENSFRKFCHRHKSEISSEHYESRKSQNCYSRSQSFHANEYDAVKDYKNPLDREIDESRSNNNRYLRKNGHYSKTILKETICKNQKQFSSTSNDNKSYYFENQDKSGTSSNIIEHKNSVGKKNDQGNWCNKNGESVMQDVDPDGSWGDITSNGSDQNWCTVSQPLVKSNHSYSDLNSKCEKRGKYGTVYNYPKQSTAVSDGDIANETRKFKKYIESNYQAFPNIPKDEHLYDEKWDLDNWCDKNDESVVQTVDPDGSWGDVVPSGDLDQKWCTDSKPLEKSQLSSSELNSKSEERTQNCIVNNYSKQSIAVSKCNNANHAKSLQNTNKSIYSAFSNIPTEKKISNEKCDQNNWCDDDENVPHNVDPDGSWGDVVPSDSLDQNWCTDSKHLEKSQHSYSELSIESEEKSQKGTVNNYSKQSIAVSKCNNTKSLQNKSEFNNSAFPNIRKDKIVFSEKCHQSNRCDNGDESVVKNVDTDDCWGNVPSSTIRKESNHSDWSDVSVHQFCTPITQADNCDVNTYADCSVKKRFTKQSFQEEYAKISPKASPFTKRIENNNLGDPVKSNRKSYSGDYKEKNHVLNSSKTESMSNFKENESCYQVKCCSVESSEDVRITKNDSGNGKNLENSTANQTISISENWNCEDSITKAQNSSCEVYSGGVCSKSIIDPLQFNDLSFYLSSLESEAPISSEKIKNIVDHLDSILKCQNEGLHVELYGSYYSGIVSSISNVNLTLVSDKLINLREIQKCFAERLLQFHFMPFEDPKIANKSKICFMDNDSSISFEIAHFRKTIGNYQNMSRLLKAVCNFDPKVKTLLIAARVWAEYCEISEFEDGKLHPVSFAMLMIYFLQQLEKPVLPVIDTSSSDWGLIQFSEKNPTSIGELWINFLKFYSQCFDFTKHVVTVTCKNKVLKQECTWGNAWIAIEDPIAHVNMGNSVKTVDNKSLILSYFTHSYEFYMSLCKEENQSNLDSSEDSADKLHKYCFSVCKSAYESSSNLDMDCEEVEDEFTEAKVKSLISLKKLPKLNDFSAKCTDKVLIKTAEKFLLNQSKSNGRKAFANALQNFIKLRFKGAVLTLFGSSVNGFGYAKSDLDICMTMKGTSSEYVKNNACRFLKNMRNHLQNHHQSKYEKVFVLQNATIPLVKFTSSEMGWSCDVSLYNVLAVHNSRLLRAYSTFDKRCPILGCALKLLCKKANIVGNVERCFSSYAYAIMVIHYLQQVEPPVLPVFPIEFKEEFEKSLEPPKYVFNNCNYWYTENSETLRSRYLCTENKMTVGELWIGLLEYYLQFDREKAVTINQKNPMPASELSKRSLVLDIEDPFIPKRNLGSSISDTKALQIMKVFQRARDLFGRNVQENLSDLESYYFSPRNLTGRYDVKDVECSECGNYGHLKENCQKRSFVKPRTRGTFPIPKYKQGVSHNG